MKTEIWNGYEIRFIEKDGEWWAVAKDVADALGYANPSKAIIDHCKKVSKVEIPLEGGKQEQIIISEIDIYNLIFKATDQNTSDLITEKADQFQTWVFEVIKILRVANGLEIFQIFRMLDKEYQEATMDTLNESLSNTVKDNDNFNRNLSNIDKIYELIKNTNTKANSKTKAKANSKTKAKANSKPNATINTKADNINTLINTMIDKNTLDTLDTLINNTRTKR